MVPAASIARTSPRTIATPYAPNGNAAAFAAAFGAATAASTVGNTPKFRDRSASTPPFGSEG